eukprot:6587756-Lingulodinium_polyedra.AAC.1
MPTALAKAGISSFPKSSLAFPLSQSEPPAGTTASEQAPEHRCNKSSCAAPHKLHSKGPSYPARARSALVQMPAQLMVTARDLVCEQNLELDREFTRALMWST